MAMSSVVNAINLKMKTRSGFGMKKYRPCSLVLFTCHPKGRPIGFYNFTKKPLQCKPRHGIFKGDDYGLLGCNGGAFAGGFECNALKGFELVGRLISECIQIVDATV